MTAQQARKLTEERKEHEQLILLIERDAKNGKTETDLEILNTWISEEIYYELTESDRIWLKKNGYKTEIRKDYHPMAIPEEDEKIDIEYVIW